MSLGSSGGLLRLEPGAPRCAGGNGVIGTTSSRPAAEAGAGLRRVERGRSRRRSGRSPGAHHGFLEHPATRAAWPSRPRVRCPFSSMPARRADGITPRVKPCAGIEPTRRHGARAFPSSTSATAPLEAREAQTCSAAVAAAAGKPRRARQFSSINPITRPTVGGLARLDQNLRDHAFERRGLDRLSPYRFRS